MSHNVGIVLQLLLVKRTFLPVSCETQVIRLGHNLALIPAESWGKVPQGQGPTSHTVSHYSGCSRASHANRQTEPHPWHVPPGGSDTDTPMYFTIFLFSESEAAQSCPTLCDPMDCSLPGSSLHGILQARVLEWVAISFSRGSSQPKDRAQVSRIVDRRFTIWATRRVFSSVVIL